MLSPPLANVALSAVPIYLTRAADIVKLKQLHYIELYYCAVFVIDGLQYLLADLFFVYVCEHSLKGITGNLIKLWG